MSLRSTTLCLVLLIFVGLLPSQVIGQEDAIITADNVETLQSALQINFDSVPQEAGEIVSGWLRVDATGERVVTVNRANDLLLWDITNGALLATYQVVGADGTNANMMDIAWAADGSEIHSLHTDGASYFAGIYTPVDDQLTIITIPTADDRPVRIWAGEEVGTTWVEVMPADPADAPYVLQLDTARGEVLNKLDSIAEADRTSQVRIGRMPAPLAVTSSVEGVVRLWNLETGSLLNRLEVDAMPTFGHINGGTGRQLVWRDTASENLYLLDFDDELNQFVAPLDGTYVQALLLGQNGDVIIGVNLDLEPIVVAWDVSTGARTELGPYRLCDRTPDMVQLNEDGTTLVIGCNTGLDVWRVPVIGEAS